MPRTAAAFYAACILFASMSPAQALCRRDSTPEQAIPACTALIESHNLQPAAAADAYAIRAHAYQNRGRLDEALRDYYAALKFKPDDPKLLWALGNIYVETRNFDKALHSYDRAIEQDSQFFEALINRCYVHNIKGQSDAAITDCRRALSLNPNSALVFIGLANSYLDKADFKKAISEFTSAVALEPQNTNALMGRASAYDKLEDRRTAIEDYSKVIALEPSRATAWNNRCWSRAIVGDLPEALADCNKSLEIRPNDAETLDSRGFVYLKMNELEKALADYSLAISLRSDMASAFYGRGIAKLRQHAKGNEVNNTAKGDGLKDIDTAEKINPAIGDLFEKYGVAKPKREIPQSSQKETPKGK